MVLFNFTFENFEKNLNTFDLFLLKRAVTADAGETIILINPFLTS